MSTAALKRELALLRSSLAALTPSESATLQDPVAWAERSAGLTLDPWQRDVLLSAAPRLLLNATRQSGKSTVAALKAAWTVLQGGLAVVVSPSLRQSGFLFRKLARHLVASDAAFRRETIRVRHLDRRDRGPVLAEVPGIMPHPGTPFLHGRTQPDPLQLADAVRGQEHPGADFAKGWGLLVNRSAQPMGDQGIRGEKAADPAPNDDYV
jgi:hypothetical protein